MMKKSKFKMTMVNTPEAEDNQNKYVRGEETDGVMTTEEKIQK